MWTTEMHCLYISPLYYVKLSPPSYSLNSFEALVPRLPEAFYSFLRQQTLAFASLQPVQELHELTILCLGYCAGRSPFSKGGAHLNYEGAVKYTPYFKNSSCAGAYYELLSFIYNEEIPTEQELQKCETAIKESADHIWNPIADRRPVIIPPVSLRTTYFTRTPILTEEEKARLNAPNPYCPVPSVQIVPN